MKMPTSTITAKGQITIPKEIRKALGLKAADRLLVLQEKGRVILYPIRGNVLDVHGAIKQKGSLDFKNLRKKMKEEVSKRIVGEAE
jgi:AbrB family looped-hinge helix DNA binding protein